MKRPSVRPYKKDGKKKWRVTHRGPDGETVRKVFARQTDASAYAQEVDLRARQAGVAAIAIDPSDLALLARSQARLAEHGKTLRDALDHYFRHLDATAKLTTVADAVPRYLADKEREGRSAPTLRDLRTRLGRFAATFGGRRLNEVSPAELADWLHGLAGAPQTRVNFRRVISGFYNHCRALGYHCENPVAGIKPPKVVRDGVTVYTPEEVAKLMAEAQKGGGDLAGWLALALFAGVRTAELTKLTWEGVHRRKGYVEIAAIGAKTARRRLIPVESNLAAWLALAPRVGAVLPTNARRRLKAVQELAAVPHRLNAARHSFGTYHLAAFGDAGRTSRALGHTGNAVLFAHYAELATRAEGEAYFGVFPSAPQ